MKKKFYLIIITSLVLTTAAALTHKLLNIPSLPIAKTQKQEPANKKQELSKAAKEYLALIEKFIAYKNLSFKFGYTLFAGENLNEIAEHFEGNVCKTDSFYKMVTANSELVVDSFLSVSVDHDSKKVMLTWSRLMDRRYSIFIDIKEVSEISSLAETVVEEGKSQNAYKRFKISSREGKGYVLIDLDTISGFPKRMEVLRTADGIEHFEDSRLVITYNNVNDKPIAASEFSYTNYLEFEPELRVKKQFSSYELLTNL